MLVARKHVKVANYGILFVKAALFMQLAGVSLLFGVSESMKPRYFWVGSETKPNDRKCTP